MTRFERVPSRLWLHVTQSNRRRVNTPSLRMLHLTLSIRHQAGNIRTFCIELLDAYSIYISDSTLLALLSALCLRLNYKQ